MTVFGYYNPPEKMKSVQFFGTAWIEIVMKDGKIYRNDWNRK